MGREKLAQQVERAARLADWMEQGARQGAAETGLALTPGLLTLAALIIAVTEARRGGLTRGQWRLLVGWLRRDLPPG